MGSEIKNKDTVLMDINRAWRHDGLCLQNQIISERIVGATLEAARAQPIPHFALFNPYRCLSLHSLSFSRAPSRSTHDTNNRIRLAREEHVAR